MIISINDKHFNSDHIGELKYNLDVTGEYSIYIETITNKMIVLDSNKIPEEPANISYTDKEKYYYETYIKKELEQIVEKINIKILKYKQLEHSMLLKNKQDFNQVQKRMSN